MTTFEDLFCKAKAAAEATGKKASEVVEVTKLKMAAASAEKDLCASFEGLGRLVFDTRQDGTEVTDSMIDSCVAQIKEQQEALKALRTSIDEHKKGLRCEACGMLNSEDSCYCKKCGKKLT